MDAIQKIADKVKAVDLEDPKTQAVAAVVGAAVAYKAYKLLKGKPRVVQNGKFKGVPLPADAYDAVIVGGGPSGNVCAYYFTKVRAALRTCADRRRTSPIRSMSIGKQGAALALGNVGDLVCSFGAMFGSCGYVS